MSIDRLSSTAALIAALRADASRKTERTRGQSAGATTRNEAGKRTPAHDAAALRRELTDLVKGVSCEDETAMREVRPRIVKAVLLWEFGAELREYGEWQPMLDTLVQTLESDSRHRTAFAEMVRDLQR